MNDKPTPGPWMSYTPAEQPQIRKDAKSYVPRGWIWRIGSMAKQGGGPLCLLFRAHPNDDDPREADICLMAAAPDLLEAAEFAAAALKDKHMDDVREKLLAAIACAAVPKART